MRQNKGYDYFQMFIEASKFSEQAAVLLRNILDDFKTDEIKDNIIQMHTIEQAADFEKHKMQSALAKAFMTPIEREDIMALAQNLDDVTDAVEDVLMRLYMYNILTIREDVKAFVDVILQCCQALTQAMEALSQFRRSQKDPRMSLLTKNLIEVNRLEEEGDQLYSKAVRKLYLSENNPIQIIAWGEIYERLEKCCDVCETVAKQVDNIVLKNS